MVYWVAIEDADTHEVSGFSPAADKQVLDLMAGYRVKQHEAARIRLHDVEDGHHVVYEGVIYPGGFGYNLWIASRHAPTL